MCARACVCVGLVRVRVRVCVEVHVISVCGRVGVRVCGGMSDLCVSVCTLFGCMSVRALACVRGAYGCVCVVLK